MGRTKARRSKPARHKGVQTHKCGKIRYTSPEAAKAAAVLQSDRTDSSLSTYPCGNCRGFHLTSK